MVHSKPRQISCLNENKRSGSDKPVEPKQPTGLRSGNRHKKLSASRLNKNKLLGGCSSKSGNSSVSRKWSSNVRSAFVPGKNVSTSENNAVFGTKRSSVSERPANFVVLSRWPRVPRSQ